ncbi:hypothetical protein EBZ37_14045, partial [bacterium]|nr:hypothetical protein [bacterium]
VFFAAFQMFFGAYGIGFAQLFLYAVTVCGLALLLAALVEDQSPWPWVSFSVLVPLQPILLHINLKLWIDNARIAWVCLAAGAFCYGLKNQKRLFQHMGILVFGLAMLTKLDTVFFVPPLFLLLLSLKAPSRREFFQGIVKLFPSLAVMVLSVAAWCFFSGVKNGGVMAGTPGRPDALLIQSNPFIRYVTVTLPASFYLRSFPSVVSTSGIVLLGILLTARSSVIRRRVLACVLGTGFLLAVYSVLGALGYSKLLRYVSQSIPLTVVATCLAMGAIARSMGTLKRAWAIGLGVLVGFFFTRELAFGIKQVYFTPTAALISESLWDGD